MGFLLTKFSPINIDQAVEIRNRDGLRIELITGEIRDVKLPKGFDVDKLFEELSLQMIRSRIVAFEGILEKIQLKRDNR